MQKIYIENEWFKDKKGRTVILRGVNLSGDCKNPYPNGGTNYPTDFSDHQEVSFINRPFPIKDADEHFIRLKNWGFNCLRLITTWEAIEHKGPGQCDTKYLDYFAKICKIAGDYGFYVFLDFHQDVWSRMTGGDGAPCWLFEKIGIDYVKISQADAAIVMQHTYDYNNPTPLQREKYPLRCWLQNLYYPANGIMWTLFFGGKDFTPDFFIDNKNVQDYMQDHFISCQIQIAKKIKNFENVIGFNPLNEPSPGWIGKKWDKPLNYRGVTWTPIKGIYSTHGFTVKLPVLGLFKNKHSMIINQDKISIWLDEKQDPFQKAGAWKLNKNGTYEILKKDHFKIVNNQKIDFNRDYLSPFWSKAAENLRKINSNWILFIEKDPFDIFNNYPENIPSNVVNAGHWYDFLIMITNKFYGFPSGYKFQFKLIKKQSQLSNKTFPTLIGEFGIPYDLDDGYAYKKYAEGDHSNKPWKKHIIALDRMYKALDALLLSSTQWNYNANNRNDLRIGDSWNQEDLSIFSVDQRDNPENINSGGRALEGFVRPYPHFIQGTPLKIKFNRKTGRFYMKYKAVPSIDSPTEIFIPKIQYPNGFEIQAQNVEINYDTKNQLVYLQIRKKETCIINVIIKRKKEV